MSLEYQVFTELKNAGLKLKNDLWRKDDIDLLRQRAKDLVGLKSKFDSATNSDKKAEYQLAAKLVLNHVQLLACTRLNVAQQHVQDALEKLFWEVLLPALGKLLIGLIVAA